MAEAKRPFGDSGKGGLWLDRRRGQDASSRADATCGLTGRFWVVAFPDHVVVSYLVALLGYLWLAGHPRVRFC